MKAAVYYQTGGPEVFRYEDVPDPVSAPNGVVLDVKAVGIEGGDVGNRARGMLAAKPHIVGYNCAGVVREVGAQVRDRKVGDRITALMFNCSRGARPWRQNLARARRALVRARGLRAGGVGHRARLPLRVRRAGSAASRS